MPCIRDTARSVILIFLIDCHALHAEAKNRCRAGGGNWTGIDDEDEGCLTCGQQSDYWKCFDITEPHNCQLTEADCLSHACNGLWCPDHRHTHRPTNTFTPTPGPSDRPSPQPSGPTPAPTHVPSHSWAPSQLPTPKPTRPPVPEPTARPKRLENVDWTRVRTSAAALGVVVGAIACLYGVYTLARAIRTRCIYHQRVKELAVPEAVKQAAAERLRRSRSSHGGAGGSGHGGRRSRSSSIGSRGSRTSLGGSKHGGSKHGGSGHGGGAVSPHRSDGVAMLGGGGMRGSPRSPSPMRGLKHGGGGMARRSVSMPRSSMASGQRGSKANSGSFGAAKSGQDLV